MESCDRKSSNPSGNGAGTAAARQPEQPISAPEEQPATEQRAARVAELQEQYQRGTYQVDAAALSSDIIAKHLKK